METGDKNKIVKSNSQFTNWINALQKNAILEVVFGICFGLFMQYAIFINTRNNTLSILLSIAISVAVIIYIYGRTLFRGKVISHTVNEVIVTSDKLILTTYPVKLLWFLKWKSVTEELDLAHLSFTESEYPFIDKDRINSKAIMLNVDGVNFYVLREALDLSEILAFQH
ncbi:hypothetical protein ACS5PU_02225 [Pedobacter sp. GSP4]|uniref:hypothetical protein n=1 Tax=Pedobacter sp. GSP4 TaxID=3453716 RepID=UPI003EEF376A